MATKTYKVVIDVDSKDVNKLEKDLQAVGAQVEHIEDEVSGLTIDDKFKAASGSIKIMAGALAGAVGTLGLFGVESEVMGEFEKKAASAIAVAIGFRDVAEGLNDMRVALKGVTVAQLKANAAALANPYVLLGVAVAGLVAGFAKLASVLTDNIVGPFESFVNMVKSLGNPFKFLSLQAESMANNLKKLEDAAAALNMDRTIKVMQAFGQDTLDLEIKRGEEQLEALEEGSEEYDNKLTEILVLRARRAKQITDKEIADAKQAEIDKANAKIDAMAAAEKASRARLDKLKEKWKLEEDMAQVAKEWDEWSESTGESAAEAFAKAFGETIKEEFDPNSIMWMDEDEALMEEELFGSDGAITKFQNGLQAAIDKTLGDREKWQNFINLASEAFAHIEGLSQQRYERTLINLERERNAILSNVNLTEEGRIKALEEIEKKEKAIEIRRIKAERDQFTLKMTLLGIEEVSKAKAYAMEQIQIARLNVAKATATAQEIALAGTAAIGKASMSIGAFVAALGPFGIAAFGLSIGGIIASIISARKKAKAQISAIGGASSGGPSGGGVSIPSAPTMQQDQTQTPQTQFCAQPSVRAYVLSGDARTAQEADAKLGARRTLG